MILLSEEFLWFFFPLTILIVLSISIILWIYILLFYFYISLSLIEAFHFSFFLIFLIFIFFLFCSDGFGLRLWEVMYPYILENTAILVLFPLFFQYIIRDVNILCEFSCTFFGSISIGSIRKVFPQNRRYLPTFRILYSTNLNILQVYFYLHGSW